MDRRWRRCLIAMTRSRGRPDSHRDLNLTRRLNPAGFLSFTTDGQRCVGLQRRFCLRRTRICSISQNAQTKQAPKQAAISKNRKALLASVIALMDIARQQACHEVRGPVRYTRARILALAA